jgi:hypothetical protein
MLFLQAQAAAAEWGFNCGPAAVCALLEMTPNELLPHLGEFIAKGYTNPTLMKSILASLGYSTRRLYQATSKYPDGDYPPLPRFGVMRIQWGGPWCKEGVPMAARYRHTHWVAVKYNLASGSPAHSKVFDVNALATGPGWLPFTEWSRVLVPGLIKQCEPKGDGDWWPTHCWEVVKP